MKRENITRPAVYAILPDEGGVSLKLIIDRFEGSFAVCEELPER